MVCPPHQPGQAVIIVQDQRVSPPGAQLALNRGSGGGEGVCCGLDVSVWIIIISAIQGALICGTLAPSVGIRMKCNNSKIASALPFLSWTMIE